MNIDRDRKQAADVYDRPRVIQLNDEHDEPMWYGGVITEDDPKGERTRRPVTIPVYSNMSARYRRAEENSRARLLKLKGRKLKDGAESLKREAQLVAECCDPWDGIFYGEGENEKPLPFTIKNAVMVFRTFPHIQRQIEAEMDDLDAFTAAASAS